MSRTGRTPSGTWRLACGLGLGLVLGLSVLGGWPARADAPTRMGQAWEPCLVAAAARYDIAADLLRAIVQVESAGHPWALQINGRDRHAGTVWPSSWADAIWRLRHALAQGRSVDIGLAQINVQHPRRFGVDPVWLLDPCINLEWSAWVMRGLLDRYGETWEAVMRYNGRNPTYAWRIREAWARIAAARHDQGQ